MMATSAPIAMPYCRDRAALAGISGGGPPPGTGAGPAGAPAEAPKGPPPELLATVNSARRGGMILAVAIAVIVFLMVVKPF